VVGQEGPAAVSFRYSTHTSQRSAQRSRIQKGENGFMYLLTYEVGEAEAGGGKVRGCPGSDSHARTSAFFSGEKR
jgi:hypothetical protein